MSRSAPGTSTSIGSRPMSSQVDAKKDVKTDPKSDVKNGLNGQGPAAPKSGPAPATVAASAGASKPVAPAPVMPAAPKSSKEKLAALGQAVGQIEKAFGKGSIMKMDVSAYQAIPGVSTGALSIDLALGGKGIPRGRIAEIFGPESSGKTTLALTVLANAQRDGGVAAFIDAEHVLDLPGPAAWV